MGLNRICKPNKPSLDAVTFINARSLQYLSEVIYSPKKYPVCGISGLAQCIVYTAIHYQCFTVSAPLFAGPIIKPAYDCTEVQGSWEQHTCSLSQPSDMLIGHVQKSRDSYPCPTLSSPHAHWRRTRSEDICNKLSMMSDLSYCQDELFNLSRRRYQTTDDFDKMHQLIIIRLQYFF